MSEIPSIRTHPVLMSLITVIVVVGIYVFGVASGYWMHSQLAAKNENRIIRDDEVASKKTDAEEVEGLNEIYSNAEILNSFEESECAKCFGTVPLPDAWDTIMYTGSDREESEFD